MTVEELIDALYDCDPQSVVMIDDDCELTTVDTLPGTFSAVQTVWLT